MRVPYIIRVYVMYAKKYNINIVYICIFFLLRQNFKIACRRCVPIRYSAGKKLLFIYLFSGGFYFLFLLRFFCQTYLSLKSFIGLDLCSFNNIRRLHVSCSCFITTRIALRPKNKKVFASRPAFIAEVRVPDDIKSVTGYRKLFLFFLIRCFYNPYIEF